MIDELIVLVLVVRGTVCIPENSVIELSDRGVWLKFFFTVSPMSGISMIAVRCGFWERSFDVVRAACGDGFHAGAGAAARWHERVKVLCLVRVSSTNSGADPTSPDHQQHCENPHDFLYRGQCRSRRVPQPADGHCCWVECGMLRHGFCGSLLHAFRWRRVVVVEPRRRLRHRLLGAPLRWPRHRDHRDHSDLWLHVGVISRCLINGRISSPRSM